MAVGEAGAINVTDQPLYLLMEPKNTSSLISKPMKFLFQINPIPAITQHNPAFTQKIALPTKSI